MSIDPENLMSKSVDEILNHVNGNNPAIRVKDIDDGCENTLTVDEILEVTNDPDCHTDEWEDYDHNDWLEGMLEWTSLRPVFPTKQKFWWTDPDNGSCSGIVELSEETEVESMDDTMRCDRGEFPLSELHPIMDNENRVYKTFDKLLLWISYDGEWEASYFITDADGYELDSGDLKTCLDLIPELAKEQDRMEAEEQDDE